MKRRLPVFSQSFRPDENFQPPFNPKADDEKAKIGETLRNHFLFQELLENDLEIIINAMIKKTVSKDDIIINEGDDADFFYVVDSGVFECFIMENGEKQVLSTYENSGCFGELALMYNVSRSSSVVAVTDGSLWALDTETFRGTLSKLENEKRLLYKSIIREIPFLSKLTESELQRLMDALESRTYEDGDCIFRQGDPGDGMYFVVAGTVVITREDSTGGQAEVKRLTRGAYFGEVALINKNNRLASAHASGRLVVAFLEVAAFERLLGPFVEVMKSRFDDYDQKLKDLIGSE